MAWLIVPFVTLRLHTTLSNFIQPESDVIYHDGQRWLVDSCWTPMTSSGDTTSKSRISKRSFSDLNWNPRPLWTVSKNYLFVLSQTVASENCDRHPRPIVEEVSCLQHSKSQRTTLLCFLDLHCYHILSRLILSSRNLTDGSIGCIRQQFYGKPCDGRYRQSSRGSNSTTPLDMIQYFHGQITVTTDASKHVLFCADTKTTTERFAVSIAAQEDNRGQDALVMFEFR